jgi:hypothetical protein
VKAIVVIIVIPPKTLGYIPQSAVSSVSNRSQVRCMSECKKIAIP